MTKAEHDQYAQNVDAQASIADLFDAMGLSDQANQVSVYAEHITSTHDDAGHLPCHPQYNGGTSNKPTGGSIHAGGLGNSTGVKVSG
jgi:hypothetical protein